MVQILRYKSTALKLERPRPSYSVNAQFSLGHIVATNVQHYHRAVANCPAMAELELNCWVAIGILKSDKNCCRDIILDICYLSSDNMQKKCTKEQ